MSNGLMTIIVLGSVFMLGVIIYGIMEFCYWCIDAHRSIKYLNMLGDKEYRALIMQIDEIYEVQQQYWEAKINLQKQIDSLAYNVYLPDEMNEHNHAIAEGLKMELFGVNEFYENARKQFTTLVKNRDEMLSKNKVKYWRGW